MIRGKNITSEDILEHQRYLKGFLSEKVLEADLTDGAFLNDVVVRSMAYVVALFEKESLSIKSRVSLNQVANIEDDTAAQVLDNLASNFFITRNEGTFAKGIIRVFVSTNENSVVITPKTLFTKSVGVNFLYAGGIDGETSLVISVSDWQSEETSTGQTLYYFDVPVVGDVEFLGSELAPGAFESVSPSIPNLVVARNLQPFSLAESMETNLNFSERIKEAITHRGFSSITGIKSYLLDTLDNLEKVIAIPSRSSLLRRDILQIDGSQTNFKTLGKCNLYTSSGYFLLNKLLQFSPDEGTVEGGVIFFEVPFSEFRSVLSPTLATQGRVDKFKDLQNNHLVTLEDNILVPGNPPNHVSANYHREYKYGDISDSTQPNTLGHIFARTSKERLLVGAENTGFTTYVNLTSVVPRVPELVEQKVSIEENEILGLDILCYSFTLKSLLIDIKYFKNTDVDSVSTSFLKTDLARYINSVSREQENISIQEIYNYILDTYASSISGIDFSESSVEMSIFMPNGRTVFFELGTSTSLSSTNTVEYYFLDSSRVARVRSFLPDNYFTYYQVGDSTCQVYADPNNITFTEVTE